MYVCICMYTCICTHVYEYMCINIHKRVNVCMDTRIHTHVYAHIHFMYNMYMIYTYIPTLIHTSITIIHAGDTNIHILKNNTTHKHSYAHTHICTHIHTYPRVHYAVDHAQNGHLHDKSRMHLRLLSVFSLISLWICCAFRLLYCQLSPCCMYAVVCNYHVCCWWP